MKDLHESVVTTRHYLTFFVLEVLGTAFAGQQKDLVRLESYHIILRKASARAMSKRNVVEAPEMIIADYRRSTSTSDFELVIL